ncbi:hypothetical protein MCEMSE6_02722 [Oxalobacteraceae bacterium]
MPKSPFSISVLNSNLFFEKAFKFGIDKEILNTVRRNEIALQATKGIQQIADHFGSQYLYSDLEDARKRFVNLVSLHLEFITHGDLNEAANVLVSKNILFHSRKGNELLLNLFNLPDIPIFGYKSSQSFKEFQREKLSLKKFYSISSYEKDLHYRQQVKEMMNAALWCSKKLGLSQYMLIEDAAPADFVIRTYLLAQLVGQSKCETKQDFMKIFFSAREKFKSIKNFRFAINLIGNLPYEHQNIVSNIGKNMEKYDGVFLSLKNYADSFNKIAEKYYIPLNGLLLDINKLDIAIWQKWESLTKGKADIFTFQTILLCVAANLPPTNTLSISKAKILIRNIRKFRTDDSSVNFFIETHSPFERQGELQSIWFALKEEVDTFILSSDKKINNALNYLKNNCVIN